MRVSQPKPAGALHDTVQQAFRLAMISLEAWVDIMAKKFWPAASAGLSPGKRTARAHNSIPSNSSTWRLMRRTGNKMRPLGKGRQEVLRSKRCDELRPQSVSLKSGTV